MSRRVLGGVLESPAVSQPSTRRLLSLVILLTAFTPLLSGLLYVCPGDRPIARSSLIAYEGGRDAPAQIGPRAKWFFSTNESIHGSAACADVDGDLLDEVLVGSADGALYCLNSSGQLKWRFPSGYNVGTTPAVNDIDSDEQSEIVFGSGDGKIYCLNSTGCLEWEYRTRDFVGSSPAVVDIDGNGHPEILAGSNDQKLYCLDSGGQMKWSFATAGAIFSSPSLGDMNGDGKLDVVFASYDRNVYCLTGAGAFQWSYPIGGAIVDSPAIADVDADSALEAVVSSNDGNVYCIAGSCYSKWIYAAPQDSFSVSPTIEDIDNDTRLEIIVGSTDSPLYCLNRTGSVKWTFNTNGNNLRWTGISFSAVVVDIDSDGQMEAVFGSGPDYSAYCLSATGGLEWSFQTGYVVSSTVAADVDNDNLIELLVSSCDGNIYCAVCEEYYSNTPGRVLATILGREGYSLQVLSGATVTLNSSAFTQSEATDSWGESVFSLVDPGIYTVTVTKNDYTDTSVMIYVETNKTRYQRIEIDKTSDAGTSPSSIEPMALVGLSLILFFGLLFIASRSSGEPEDEEKGSHGIDVLEAEGLAGKPRNSRCRLGHCSVRGASIESSWASHCHNCGAPLGTAAKTNRVATRGEKTKPMYGNCIVCNLRIARGEAIARCPYCGNIAHEMHLKEWLHVKGACPVCGNELHEKDLT